ncbi:hypothetical protein DXV76_20895 [Rhodobacteraceae bacterium CCMM004]|nr:hypothetical protein DXV76_20895 [Rhodobacteraceae bacterium CCMM004]
MKAVRVIISVLSVGLAAATALLGSFEVATAYSYGFALYEFRYEVMLVAVLALALVNLDTVGKILKFPFNRAIVGGYDPKGQYFLYAVSAFVAVTIFLLLPMHSAMVGWLKYRALYIEHEFKEDYADFLDHTATQFYDIGDMQRAADLWSESNERRDTDSAIINANIGLVNQRQEISRQLAQNAISAESRMGDYNLVAYQLYAQAILFSADNDVATTASERYRNALTRASISTEPCGEYSWFVLGRDGEEDDCIEHLASVDHEIKWQADDIGKLLAERRQLQLERPSGSQLLVSFRDPDTDEVEIVRRTEGFLTRYLRRLTSLGFVAQDLYVVVDRYDY